MTTDVSSLAVMLGTTRAAFYQRKNGGGYRTARKGFTCMQSLCLKKIEPGEQYFDTQEPVVWPRVKRICAACAETTV